MDLQELCERTGFPRRKLRYVLDHQLVPDLKIEIADTETGRPRKFHWDVGFAIICAAQLLVAGLNHESIRVFLRELFSLKLGDKLLVLCIFNRFNDRKNSKEGFRAQAFWGDGINFRVVIDSLQFDTKWRAPGNPASLDPKYEPVVQVVLNLSHILYQVIGK